METYRTTFSVKRLWTILVLGMLAMFSVLLLFGQQIYQQAPPIPAQVIDETGRVLFTRDDIQRGHHVWQANGGMQQGSIWGHGSYLAPDWSADWLHREAEALLAILADAAPLGLTPDGAMALNEAALRAELRTNTYDDTTQNITV